MIHLLDRLICANPVNCLSEVERDLMRDISILVMISTRSRKFMASIIFAIREISGKDTHQTAQIWIFGDSTSEICLKAEKETIIGIMKTRIGKEREDGSKMGD